MSNYTQITDFSAKDNLSSGDAEKIVLGADFDAEFAAIATAIGTKANSADVAAGSSNLGYLNIPQNAQSGNYTLVLTDAGKHILHGSADGSGDTYTIPANSSVAFPLGTVVTFVNLASATISIAITTDTLTLAGSTTTGTRTLGQNGIATIIKVGTTSWLISGVGVA